MLQRYTAEPLFTRELEILATEKGLRIVYLPGPRRTPSSVLGPAVQGLPEMIALQRWIPDLAECDVFLSGPSAWTDGAELHQQPDEHYVQPAHRLPLDQDHDLPGVCRPNPLGPSPSSDQRAEREDHQGLGLAATERQPTGPGDQRPGAANLDRRNRKRAKRQDRHGQRCHGDQRGLSAIPASRH